MEEKKIIIPVNCDLKPVESEELNSKIVQDLLTEDPSVEKAQAIMDQIPVASGTGLKE